MRRNLETEACAKKKSKKDDGSVGQGGQNWPAVGAEHAQQSGKFIEKSQQSEKPKQQKEHTELRPGGRKPLAFL